MSIPQYREFDYTWGISPACWNGNHKLTSDPCGGEWHLDWKPDLLDSDPDSFDKNRWIVCRCTCHGFVSDEEWEVLRRRFREFVGKAGDALSSVSDPPTSDGHTSTST